MNYKEFLHFVKKVNSTAGKITISATFVVAVIFGGILVLYSSGYISAQDTADTSVTVLNTPPAWTVDAQESAESSGTAPTNSGDNISWTGTATDSNGQNYYLIICKTNAVPTPANGGNPPTCNGGASNQWAVSASTASGTAATATYTTSESDTNQSNDWWAFVCDSPAADAACNSDQTQQGSGTTASPFVINFRPSFTAFSDDSPVDPGATVTWTTTASDSAKNTDFAYNVRLYVCKANDFTGSVCGAGGEWCNSGAFVANNPTCNAAMDNPMPDGNHNAFGFVIDDKTHAASGGAHGTDSVITINNVAPSVLAGSISILNTTGLAEALELTVAGGETTGFRVEMTVTDQNSCETLAGGDEIASAIINVYRSGIGVGNCTVDANYNDENCYPADSNAVTPGKWAYSCSQDETVEACTGTSDNSVGWSCTFPLWFNADATDAGSEFPLENWVVSAVLTDNDGLSTNSGTPVEGATGQELNAFTAFEVPETAITYGSLEAGNNTGVTNQTTALRAVGNTGLDEELEGTVMCTTFEPDPGQGGGTPDWGCTRNASDTIFSTDQKYDTAAFDYDLAGNALPDEPGVPDTVLINVPKTRDHGTIQSRNTFWGIQIPATITLAGDYSGRNFITGIASSSANW